MQIYRLARKGCNWLFLLLLSQHLLASNTNDPDASIVKQSYIELIGTKYFSPIVNNNVALTNHTYNGVISDNCLYQNDQQKNDDSFSSNTATELNQDQSALPAISLEDFLPIEPPVITVGMVRTETEQSEITNITRILTWLRRAEILITHEDLASILQNVQQYIPNMADGVENLGSNHLLTQDNFLKLLKDPKNAKAKAAGIVLAYKANIIISKNFAARANTPKSIAAENQQLEVTEEVEEVEVEVSTDPFSSNPLPELPSSIIDTPVSHEPTLILPSSWNEVEEKKEITPEVEETQTIPIPGPSPDILISPQAAPRSYGNRGLIKHDQRPTALEYALMSNYAYIKDLRPSQNISDLPYWEIIEINQGASDYQEVVFKNTRTRQVVIAYKGTSSIKNAFEDLQSIVRNKLSSHKIETFTQIQKMLQYAQKNHYHLSFTGHSLGAFLAELSVFFCHNANYPHVNAVTFESPGSYESMELLQSNLKDKKIKLKNFDIVGYVGNPNLFNTLNHHIGSLYQIEPSLGRHGQMPILYSIKCHALDNFIKYFKEPHANELNLPYYISDWPIADWSNVEDLINQMANWRNISNIPKNIQKLISNPAKLAVDIINIVGKFLFSDKSQKATYFEYVGLDPETHSYKYRAEFKNNKDKFYLTYKAHYQVEEQYSYRLTLPLRHFNYDMHNFLMRFSNAFEDLIIAREKLVREWQDQNIPQFIIDYLTKFRLEKTKDGSYIVRLIESSDPDAEVSRSEPAIHRFRDKLSNYLQNNPEKITLLYKGMHIINYKEEEGELLSDLQVTNLVNNYYVRENSANMDELTKKLKQNQGMLAITGITGAGKTRTACYYAYKKFRDRYPDSLVAVIVSDTKENLERSYRAFASELNRLNNNIEKNLDRRDLKQIKEYVKTQLQTEKNRDNGFILIFDSLDQGTYKDIESYIPIISDISSQQIIITSQKKSFFAEKEDKNFYIDGFTDDEAVDFLQLSLPSLTKEQAINLAHKFYNIPLGLQQAGVYLRTHPDFSVDQYLTALDNKEAALYLEQEEDKLIENYYPNKQQGYKTVQAAVLLTIDKLTNRARDLLPYYVFLNIDNIPKSMLKHLLIIDNKLGEGVAEVIWSNILKEYRDASLISEYSQYLSMHGMILTVLKARMTKETEIKVIKKLLSYFYKCCLAIKDHSMLVADTLTLQYPLWNADATPQEKFDLVKILVSHIAKTVRYTMENCTNVQTTKDATCTLLTAFETLIDCGNRVIRLADTQNNEIVTSYEESIREFEWLWSPLLTAGTPYERNFDAQDVSTFRLNEAAIHKLRETMMKPNFTLRLAASMGNIALAQELLNKGANLADDRENIILISAASNGHTNLVQILLNHGAQVNQTGIEKETALMAAARNNHLDTVELLLKKGADINRENRSGWTALMLAFYNGHNEVVKLLQTDKALVNTQTKLQYASLIEVAQNGDIIGAVKLLLAGAKVEQVDHDNKTALMFACENGHTEVVKLLLNKGAKINKENNLGWTALMFASENGYLEIVNLLLEKDTQLNLDKKNKYGATALIRTAIIGRFEIVKFLLEQGAQFDKVDNNGMTALMHAAANGHYKIVTLLLEKGAQLDKKNNDGWTAIMLASKNNHSEIVKLLHTHMAQIEIDRKNITSNTSLIDLTKNADLSGIIKLLLTLDVPIDKENEYGETALISAAAIGNLEIVNFFLKKGAQFDKVDNNGVTALMVASQNDHLEVIKSLLDIGAQIDKENNDKQTALMLASIKGHLAIVEFLLYRNAQVDKEDKDGRTALMFAAMNGHLEVTKLLLAKGSQVNKADKEGWTALMLAFKNGHNEIVMLLRPSDIQAYNTNNLQQTTLEEAAKNGDIKLVIKLLLEKPEDIDKSNDKNCTALMGAAENGNLEVVELLLNRGAQPNTKNIYGYNALMLASAHGHPAIVNALLEKGVLIEDETSSWSPLMAAAKAGKLEVIKLLIEKKAQINRYNKNGWNALMVATINNQYEIVKFLVNNGAEIDKKNYSGWSSLMLASTSGHYEIIKFLLDKGAQVDIENTYGQTALMEAAAKGHLEIVKLLLEKNAQIDKENKDGWNATMFAFKNDHNEIFELLRTNEVQAYDTNSLQQASLEEAAKNGDLTTVVKIILAKQEDIDKPNNDNWTALMWAANNGHLDVVNSLLKKGAQIDKKNKESDTALMLAAKNGHLEIVKLLLDRGANVDEKNNNNGVTALILAAENGHLDIVKLLLDGGANINENNSDSSSVGYESENPAASSDYPSPLPDPDTPPYTWKKDLESALMSAAKNGHLDVVELLLDKKAQLDGHNRRGKTALMFAAENGHLEVVKLLLDKATQSEKSSSAFTRLFTKNTKIDITNSRGYTALMFAAKNGHLETVKLLLARGASINAINHSRHTPLILAAENGHLETVKLLLNKGAQI